MRETKKILSLVLLAALPLVPLSAAPTNTENTPSSVSAAFGMIRGTVLDERGSPIAGAVVALWREGMANVRQIRSNADGSFTARVLPGRYSLTAMADGFTVVSLSNVDVVQSDEVAFRFNLVRTGSGNTLPERRADRNNSKYRNRANKSRRSIFQNTEGTGETLAGLEQTDEAVSEAEETSERPGQTAVETYFAASGNSKSKPYTGVNFATVKPVGEKLELTFAGQTGIGEDAPQRLETTAKFKLNDEHRVSINFGGASLGKIQLQQDGNNLNLGQISFQALDEWRIKDGIIVVLGIDYSRFVGASNAASINPRIGLQFETDSRTRLNF
ncbi:MAG TPA: carboxypeptidase-like regulatory domain-containing protein, partial [Pyrinomonadaceae bacterium]|nr:carboxypeptidase-like regulatory domain-containing protein [Pyrinomonadaceae bacterium]